jgi:hypothetical protein
MTDRLDPTLAAIEQRLERASQPTAVPGLRPRVLAAVVDALHEEVPATKSGWSGGRGFLSSPDVVAGTFFLPGWAWAAAAVLGIALTVPVVAGMEALRLREPPALAAQLRAAGVADESLLALVAHGPRPDAAIAPVQPERNTVPRRFESRVIELQRLLEEML